MNHDLLNAQNPFIPKKNKRSRKGNWKRINPSVHLLWSGDTPSCSLATGLRGDLEAAPKSDEICNPFSMFRVGPEASSMLDVPRMPSRGSVPGARPNQTLRGASTCPFPNQPVGMFSTWAGPLSPQLMALSFRRYELLGEGGIDRIVNIHFDLTYEQDSWILELFLLGQ